MKFNKISKKLAACSLAGVMMVSMLGMTAFAKTGATEAVTFEKTLDMSAAEGASVPDVAFPYLITPDDPVAATDNSPEILAGISGAKIDNVEFSHNDRVDLNKQVKKIVTVDFSKVNWIAPGIYRYTITEQNSKNADVINDSAATRTLDVYVVNDGKGGYEIASQAMIEGTAAPTGKDYATESKSDGFTNSYKTYALSLKKVVDGMMGDKGRTYNFTINFEGPANASFKMGEETITLNNAGIGSTNIGLTNGSMKTINGIPSTVKYTVVENINKNDGYTVSYTVGGSDATSATYATSTEQTMGTADNAVVCTNLKNAVTPTGIAMTVAPYILMVAVAGIFAVLFLRRRHEEA